MARLGEKRAKKKLKEDDEQEERLIKLMVEAARKVNSRKQSGWSTEKEGLREQGSHSSTLIRNQLTLDKE
ncbi:hypothetical protein RHMOL_Rhmol07G0256400 [Rhododendron molle]|uniref:Uncharacterized protein n=1 Tax=Rhododendron molle TaxID=49168 RepID=A0ACC0N665_RHOML|nr:hypothetical protein RHMOL_Rhmol07G0256400 [Rhododendron molle]